MSAISLEREPAAPLVGQPCRCRNISGAARDEKRARMAAKLKDTPPEERADPINIYAIHAMLPTRRAWGRVIIDAEKGGQ